MLYSYSGGFHADHADHAVVSCVVLVILYAPASFCLDISAVTTVRLPFPSIESLLIVLADVFAAASVMLRYSITVVMICREL